MVPMSFVREVIKAAGVAIDDILLNDPEDKSTWTVVPASLQAAAQPYIDAYNPNDPAHETAMLDRDVKALIDKERIFSAIVWAVIDTYSAPATIPKYNAARAKILSAFRTRPWKSA